ncbi:hypothetical protein D3P09_12960 [Paenibacillus pinisoli]|uniref:Uncharacterized protein n=1 Tax=Paenibacillus pinisoli TaxID=1276110 RepID=A0A3A6PIY4_9BACL|nr:hypothetical protein [Paenibacillus pinisoli]RJX40260.1 hypothetical protein D3P09_12960 [Paenibacillus pinisoli]
MKQTIISDKWKRHAIVTIGGVLMGAGIADCLFAMNELDLNQIARGLTIASAGLTILVVIDNSKTQKEAEHIQIESRLRLEQVEKKLTAIEQSQQMTESQLREIKELLLKAKS